MKNRQTFFLSLLTAAAVCCALGVTQADDKSDAPAKPEVKTMTFRLADGVITAQSPDGEKPRITVRRLDEVKKPFQAIQLHQAKPINAEAKPPTDKPVPHLHRSATPINAAAKPTPHALHAKPPVQAAKPLQPAITAHAIAITRTEKDGEKPQVRTFQIQMDKNGVVTQKTQDGDKPAITVRHLQGPNATMRVPQAAIAGHAIQARAAMPKVFAEIETALKDAGLEGDQLKKTLARIKATIMKAHSTVGVVPNRPAPNWHPVPPARIAPSNAPVRTWKPGTPPIGMPPTPHPMPTPPEVQALKTQVQTLSRQIKELTRRVENLEK